MSCQSRAAGKTGSYCISIFIKRCS